MRVEQLRAFVVLAEELNFRRAAARLFVSQPTITAQLHQLERALGVVLFHRGPSGTSLTSRGADLLPTAREVLRRLDDLAEPVGAGSVHRRRTSVRLGVGPDGIGPATWPTLHALTARRPDLEVTLVPLKFSTSLPAFDHGDVDALLLHGPVDEVGTRRVVTVGRVPVGVLVPRHHWMSQRAQLPLASVVPSIRAVPPEEMGASFTSFWFLPEVPRSVGAGVRLASEHTTTMASEAARSGLVGLWPTDVVVPAASGAVVRPLVESRWAPLQVVVRAGSWLGPDLVGAARTGVRAAAPLTPVRPVDGDHET